MDLDELFTGYGRALVTGDVPATVGYYGFPAMVITDDFVGTVPGPEELRAALEQANEFYARFGVARVRHHVETVDEVTDKLTRVRLRWEFLDADGEFVVDSSYEYTLRETADGPRFHIALSIDEAQKLAALQGS
jgi:hypothetical protein